MLINREGTSHVNVQYNLGAIGEPVEGAEADMTVKEKLHTLVDQWDDAQAQAVPALCQALLMARLMPVSANS